jgi:hypothetical protein
MRKYAGCFEKVAYALVFASGIWACIKGLMELGYL